MTSLSAGDWLQGPHVYALYDYYGMTKHEIEILFIAGFGSSLCFGTFIGSIADKLFVLLTAGLCLAVPIFFLENTTLLFIAFVLFEMCVGIFWPAMGYLRGIIVPETSRSTTMNFFRIPLNLIVIVILLNNLPMVRIFQFCVLCLLLASGIQHYLFTLRSSIKLSDGQQAVKDPLNQEV
ncbi:hypothetical protein QR680_003414 [Steinernema hermaphroditum]|uniref:Uncharacterized protein n=1 Tax=Steinernema hermaphroditum TaxID=289476 RepID=A0AA39LKB6_9BILA|nr:hypothetical protein QR680_003414 [Steinernema hermaphroditum]